MRDAYLYEDCDVFLKFSECLVKSVYFENIPSYYLTIEKKIG